MRFKNIDDLIQTLQLEGDVGATKGLTKFFVGPRFGLTDDEFSRHYCDGADDGGIDLFFEEDNSFFIIQTKFTASTKQASDDTVIHEMHKIGNTLSGENLNRRAEEFVNGFRRTFNDPSKRLEIIWLTTNEVKESVAEKALEELKMIREKYGWKLQVDFVEFDKNGIQRLISDIAHGYIPYIGRKILPISEGKVIRNTSHSSGIDSVVCSVKVTDIVRWIIKKKDINRYLQKNVREYVGETKINKEIQKSFLNDPDWFWYKHNGIIIFADSISIPSGTANHIEMRNPQIVNGGQTLFALYEAYDGSERKESGAEVLLRVYSLPYERTETYDKGIEIIKALNSQNAIKPSDLHSTDPRQVRLQELFKLQGYLYWRKRSNENRAGKNGITMRKLALYYYTCSKDAPHDGARRDIEEIFEETKSKYNIAFPEEAINREVTAVSHILFSYILVWQIAELLDKFKKGEIKGYDLDIFEYTFFYVLNDVFRKTLDWRTRNFNLSGYHNWIDFIKSSHYKRRLWPYLRADFAIARKIVPRNEEAKKFFKRLDAKNKFATKTNSSRPFDKRMNLAFEEFERVREDED